MISLFFQIGSISSWISLGYVFGLKISGQDWIGFRKSFDTAKPINQIKITFKFNFEFRSECSKAKLSRKIWTRKKVWFSKNQLSYEGIKVTNKIACIQTREVKGFLTIIFHCQSEIPLSSLIKRYLELIFWLPNGSTKNLSQQSTSKWFWARDIQTEPSSLSNTVKGSNLSISDLRIF